MQPGDSSSSPVTPAPSRNAVAVAGILLLAYKLLVNDRAKFSGLLVGLTFSVFLMIEMASLFTGVLNRSSSTVFNIGASICA